MGHGTLPIVVIRVKPLTLRFRYVRSVFRFLSFRFFLCDVWSVWFCPDVCRDAPYMAVQHNIHAIHAFLGGVSFDNGQTVSHREALGEDTARSSNFVA